MGRLVIFFRVQVCFITKNSFESYFLLAGVRGIEPLIKVLETFVIPFNYTPKLES